MQFQSLGWKDPLEKGLATHSNILAWRIPWANSSDSKESACNTGDVDSIPGLGRSPGEGKGFSTLAWRIPWTTQSMRSQRVEQDWVTFTFTYSSLEDPWTEEPGVLQPMWSQSWTRLRQLSMQAHWFSYITLKHKNSNTYLCMTAMTLSYTECTYYWLHKSLNFVIKTNSAWSFPPFATSFYRAPSWINLIHWIDFLENFLECPGPYWLFFCFLT